MKYAAFKGCMAFLAVLTSLNGSISSAQSLKIIHTFRDQTQQLNQGVISDPYGNLYGTTYGTPATSMGGTVFKLNNEGELRTLVTFTGPNGANPAEGHLIRDEAGNLYGTTTAGGTLPNGSAGSGIVYKLDPEGKETVLYVFTDGADGSSPGGTLLRDSQGNLYGTTAGDSFTNFGNVFKLNPQGELTVLHQFGSGNDGQFPGGGLAVDAAGDLFGVTVFGGAAGQGIVFEITKSGGYQVLYTFQGTPDGANPYDGELVVGLDGSLYGTTTSGGTFGFGTVFKVDPTGQETILHNFAGSTGLDGLFPKAGLTPDGAGNLYGATLNGGTDPNVNGAGTIFKIDAQGNYSLLFSFPESGQEGSPNTRLLRNARGDLFGTTLDCECGSTYPGGVFKLKP